MKWKKKKKGKSVRASKRLEMCDQNEDRKPGAERRTLAARNAEAGVFVSVVAIFTLHPWHLALFRCPRGRYPSAVGSPCRAFPTHFSFYFSRDSQKTPCPCPPPPNWKNKKGIVENAASKRESDSISYQRTFEPIIELFLFFLSFFFFFETSLQIEIWTRFIRFHVVDRLLISLSWRMDKRHG